MSDLSSTYLLPGRPGYVYESVRLKPAASRGWSDGILSLNFRHVIGTRDSEVRGGGTLYSERVVTYVQYLRRVSLPRVLWVMFFTGL